MTRYEEQIVNRSYFQYLKGLIVRWRLYRYYKKNRMIARKKGATIGEGVVMTRELAKMANKNLTIGDHSLVMTTQMDLRSPITIGKNVMIVATAKILTSSHSVDSPTFDLKNGGVFIEDFVWITAKAFITPSCHIIGYGAVVGAGSCVVKDVEPMTIVGGNPAREIRKRKQVHSELIVESLQSADYLFYKKARTEKNKLKWQ